MRKFLRGFFTPTRATVSSFVLLILFGAVLLASPFAAAKEKGVSAIDALFVSTSAVCVTGLSPIDVGTEFNLAGQIIILLLMQFGGLGFMTFTTAVYVWIGKRISVTEKLLVSGSFAPTRGAQFRSILKYVVAFTLLVEMIGAAILFTNWMIQARFESALQTAWYAIFHAVSAFTNGSFSLFSDSLIGFNRDKITMLTMSFLIFFGGIGFLVFYEISAFFGARLKRRRVELSVQTKLILVVLSVLITGSVIVFLVQERNGAFAEMSFFDSLVNAFFYSVAPRTSGFNALPIDSFHAFSLFLIVILMFIGSSPGSTAGGIKTTTVGLLAAYAFSKIMGKQRVSLWNRTVSRDAVDRATGVVTASVAVVVTAVLILLATENAGKERFLALVFETVSAFGTVGFSMDQTPLLTTAGKAVISLVMLTGRVGAISLTAAISVNATPESYTYAEEDIMIG